MGRWGRPGERWGRGSHGQSILYEKKVYFQWKRRVTWASFLLLFLCLLLTWNTELFTPACIYQLNLCSFILGMWKHSMTLFKRFIQINVSLSPLLLCHLSTHACGRANPLIYDLSFPCFALQKPFSGEVILNHWLCFSGFKSQGTSEVSFFFQGFIVEKLNGLFCKFPCPNLRNI